MNFEQVALPLAIVVAALILRQKSTKLRRAC